MESGSVCPAERVDFSSYLMSWREWEKRPTSYGWESFPFPQIVAAGDEVNIRMTYPHCLYLDQNGTRGRWRSLD